MKITKKMVMELNNELAAKGCPFRYEYDEAEYSGNPHMKIVLPSMSCVDSFIVNPTKEFFQWMEIWFETRGVELSCNNDGSILWSKNGWEQQKSQVESGTMTRSEMIDFIKKNPYICITHDLFDEDEYIYSGNDGLVWDEHGCLFEDWDLVLNKWSSRNGIRMRDGKEWQNGWSIKE